MDINEIARKAWDDGFKTAVGYNDNHIFCVGEQRDRVWKKYWETVNLDNLSNKSIPKVEAITLEGEQGEPAGIIKVTAHYDNGTIAELIRTGANSIYHYVRLSSPDITHKYDDLGHKIWRSVSTINKIDLLISSGWVADGFAIGKMNLVMKSGTLPPRTVSIDVNEASYEQFGEYIKDGLTELERRKEK